MKKFKRILSFALSFSLLLTAVPQQAFAEEGSGTGSQGRQDKSGILSEDSSASRTNYSVNYETVEFTIKIVIP